MRIVLLILIGVLTACTSPISSRRPSPAHQPFFRIDRSHTSSGSGTSWTISDGHIRIAAESSSNVPSAVFFERALSETEIAAVFAAIEQSGIRSNSTRDVWLPPENEHPVLSDFMITSFQFIKGSGEDARASVVRYWSDVDHAAKTVLRAVDTLLPGRYRISPPTEQSPNKAPEPTPGLVTPRALE